MFLIKIKQIGIQETYSKNTEVKTTENAKKASLFARSFFLGGRVFLPNLLLCQINSRHFNNKPVADRPNPICAHHHFRHRKDVNVIRSVFQFHCEIIK